MEGNSQLRQSVRRRTHEMQNSRVPRSGSSSSVEHTKSDRNLDKSTHAPSSATGPAETDEGNFSAKRRRYLDLNHHMEASYTYIRGSGAIADWDDYFRDLKAISWVCPVHYFPNAPLAEQWKSFAVDRIGSKIELPHPRSVGVFPVYSVATIVNFAGYKALVKFENTKNTRNHYAWISYCSDQPKPLGYSIVNNLLVFAVESINNNHPNETGHLQFIERIYGAEPSVNSISMDHDAELSRFLAEYQEQNNYKLNHYVEAMDKEDPIQNRLAVVTAVVGDRVQIEYLDGSKNDQGFCFNSHSDLIHPFGWSNTVGLTLVGFNKSDCHFPTLPDDAFPVVPPNITIQNGMVFEVRHPFFPYKLAIGVVKKKLKFGYFIASIETNDKRDLAEFVFHVTSDYILPCGFSSTHKIPLESPQGEDSYILPSCMQKNQLHPLNAFIEKRSHHFVKGCKLESVDVFEPMYYGPATVLNVAGHLLYIHFDGWPRSDARSYQWISAFSHDIYPAGWSEVVGHRLQGHAERPQSCDSFYIANINEDNTVDSSLSDGHHQYK